MASAHRGKWGQLKKDEKLKSENMKKEHFSVLQNAQFRS